MSANAAENRRRAAVILLAGALVGLAAAACQPVSLLRERKAVLEVVSTRPGSEASVEIAAAEAARGAAWPEGPVTTPYRRRVSVSRAAVMVRLVSGPPVRVRLRSRRGGELRHEVETTTSDVALVTGGWRYLPGSWASAAGF